MQSVPFIVRKELRDPAKFHGRQSELKRIISLLNKDDPQNVQLVGQRRIGKSFVLQNIALNRNLLVESFGSHINQFTVVHLNLAKRPPESPTHFYHDITRAIQDKLPPHLADAFLYVKAAESDLDLDDAIDEGIRMLESAEHHVIFLLDEFPIITANPAFSPSFFSRLRTLAESSALAFVIATHRPLSELCHSGDIADSPFFNLFTKIHIRPLTPDEARSFICEPFARCNITFEKGALTEVERLTGHHPAILATLGNLLWSRCKDNEIVSQLQVATTYEELYSSFVEDFGYYWRHLSQDAQQLALQLHRGAEVPKASRAKSELIDASLAREEKGRLILFSALFARYVENREVEPHDIYRPFADTTEYYSRMRGVFNARLLHEPILPEQWSIALRFAINMFEDQPGVACFTCGRDLLRKYLLSTIATHTMYDLQQGESSTGIFLREINSLIPSAGQGNSSAGKPITRMLYQELWHLKHLGDCGAHSDEYDLTPRDAAEAISLAIDACQRLIQAGYYPR